MLEFAQEKGLDWRSGKLCAAGQNGHINVLDWIDQYHRVQFSIFDVTPGSRIHVIQWMKEHGMMDREEDNVNVWFGAAKEGHVHVLEWILDHGFTRSDHASNGVAAGGRIDVLLWTREKGLDWNAQTCAWAASQCICCIINLHLVSPFW